MNGRSNAWIRRPLNGIASAVLLVVDVSSWHGRAGGEDRESGIGAALHVLRESHTYCVSCKAGVQLDVCWKPTVCTTHPRGGGFTFATLNRCRDGETSTLRLTSLCLVGMVAVLLLSAPRAEAQLAPAQVNCRKSIGKGVRALADTVIKERIQCHKLRMLGTLLPSIDCNDAQSAPMSGKVGVAKAKLASSIQRDCAGLSPADNQYVACPAPCGATMILDYAGVAACFMCVTEAHAGDAITTVYDTPPAPSAPETAACQRYIGQALRKYLTSRMKEQQRCQLAEDRVPTSLDCQTADVKGRVAKARARVDSAIGRCDPGAFSDLNSCGADLIAERMCVKDVAELQADYLFDAVYRPSTLVPTATATVFSTHTATLPPAATPTASATPTETVPPLATETPTQSPSATPTSTTVLQPCNPDSESYSEPPFYRSLAYRWAPIIIHDTASKWNADFIGKINFDNDWRSNNNWDNLPSAGIAPYLYYNVLETSTHWFIHYHTFHPRDWNNAFFGTCGPDPDCHENDTENLLVMVQKDGSTYGRFRVLETMAHGNFYQYALAGDGVGNGTGPDADDIDNDPERGFTLFTDTSVGVNDPRPAIYIESKGHGICEWWDNNGPSCSHPDDQVGTSGNDGVMYYPSEGATPSVPPNPEGGQWYDFKSPYNLISLWDDVWVLRSCLSGATKTFDIPFTYAGVSGNGSPNIGKAMDGDDHADDAATAWWAQTDDDNNLAAGEWTFDPAATVVRQLTFSESVDGTYQFNPFLGIQ